VRKVEALIRGLTLIREKVTGASFYNSSGGAVCFETMPLTDGEIEELKGLGWEAWNPYENQGTACFAEDGDWA
jgi:hypothetical protein